MNKSGGYAEGLMWHRMLKPLVLGGAALLLLDARPALADEVDDILALKARNQDRFHRLSAEITVETVRPGTAGKAKPAVMRYRMTLVKRKTSETGQAFSPWTIDMEMIEPTRIKTHLEGTHVSIERPDGSMQSIEISAAQQQQVEDMVRPFTGNAMGWRDQFAIRVLRHNRPWFRPSTTTVEYIPKAQKKLFARIEEDVDRTGLVMAKRFFNEQGQESVRGSVLKHRIVHGFPIAEITESVIQSPQGEVHSRTSWTGVNLELLTSE